MKGYTKSKLLSPSPLRTVSVLGERNGAHFGIIRHDIRVAIGRVESRPSPVPSPLKQRSRSSSPKVMASMGGRIERLERDVLETTSGDVSPSWSRALEGAQSPAQSAAKMALQKRALELGLTAYPAHMI